MRNLSWTSAAVCLLIAVPHAQGTTQAPPTPAHNTMVLTGCLVAGTDESTFKLTNALPNPQASASQPQPVGTSGARAEYELKAEKDLAKSGVAPVELKAFVGHEVEITARAADEPTTSAPAQQGGGVTADPDPTKPIEKKDLPLMVTAVKQVRATCR